MECYILTTRNGSAASFKSKKCRVTSVCAAIWLDNEGSLKAYQGYTVFNMLYANTVKDIWKEQQRQQYNFFRQLIYLFVASFATVHGETVSG